MPLGHSFSQRYFTEKFSSENINAQYNLYPLESINCLIQLLDNEQLLGFNVTIPYKEQIIPFLDYISPEAEDVGAVNVVKVVNDVHGRHLHGYNSDIYGFRQTIEPMISQHHNSALILGTGGASKAVSAVMRKLGVKYTFVSRDGKNGAMRYSDLTKNVIEQNLIIVNASPVGMFPNVDNCPNIPYEFITDQHVVYDLIYNPETTKFLQLASRQGAKISNGLKMLYLQAEKAWEIWNN